MSRAGMTHPPLVLAAAMSGRCRPLAAHAQRAVRDFWVDAVAVFVMGYPGVEVIWQR